MLLVYSLNLPAAYGCCSSRRQMCIYTVTFLTKHQKKNIFTRPEPRLLLSPEHLIG